MSEYGWLWLCAYIVTAGIVAIMWLSMNLGKAIGL